MSDNTFYEITTSLKADKSIGMYYCGKRVKTKKHIYGPEIREHYLFVFVNDGIADMYQNGKIIRRLKKNDLFVMCPGEKIYYRAKTPWSIQWVGLYGETVDIYTKKLGLTGENPIMAIKSHFEIKDNLEQLYLNAQENNIYSEPMQVSLIYAFFAILFREKGYSQNRDYTATAKNIIEYNLNQALSVKSIANSLHIDAAYFTRLFTEQEGITPKRYILKQKMNRAKFLLTNTNANIEEIANSVGFTDALYFSRIFRKKEKVSPTEYRKSRVNL